MSGREPPRGSSAGGQRWLRAQPRCPESPSGPAAPTGQMGFVVPVSDARLDQGRGAPELRGQDGLEEKWGARR